MVEGRDKRRARNGNSVRRGEGQSEEEENKFSGYRVWGGKVSPNWFNLTNMEWLTLTVVDGGSAKGN